MRTRILFIATNFFAALSFLWPFLSLSIPQSLLERSFISIAIIVIAVVIIASEISEQLLDSKTVAIIGVLAAAIAALRLLGAGAIGIEPIWFLLILASRVFGARLGYSLGVIALAVSAIITGGIGPWLAFQMFAAGWVAAGVAVIPRSFRGKLEIGALALYGALASLLFGILMDLQLWPWLVGTDSQLSFDQTLSAVMNVKRFITFHIATALAWDLPRAITTASLLALTARPILHSLRRAKVRLHLNERANAQAAIL